MMRLLVVGNPSTEHVGAHFLNGARALGVDVQIIDSRKQFTSARLLNAVWWHLFGHRPPRLRSFSRAVTRAAVKFRPDLVLVTGEAGILDADIRRLNRMGVITANFVTDDPWNKRHRAGWFLKALAVYAYVYTPRRANLDDLKQLGCRRISYLPFAYAPEIHYPELPDGAEEWHRFASDVAFVGGADSDRVPYISALRKAGIKLAIYGGYWDKVSDLRECYRGFAGPSDLRKLAGAAKVSLCLVRRANRDGHSMRSYELAAMKACIVAEDTTDHRELYGPDGSAYFQTVDDLVLCVRQVLKNALLGQRIRENARCRVINGANTYADRLRVILEDATKISDQTES